MDEQILLPNFQLRIWPPAGTHKPTKYLDLELFYSPKRSRLIVKQYPELDAEAISFVGYSIDISSVTFLCSSEDISTNTRIFYLQVKDRIDSQASVDPSTPQDRQQEDITTLKMCCTLIDTSIPASSKVDLVVPDQAQHSDNIAALLGMFGDIATSDHSSNVEPFTINVPSKTPTASIILDEEADDYLCSHGSAKPLRNPPQDSASLPTDKSANEKSLAWLDKRYENELIEGVTHLHVQPSSQHIELMLERNFKKRRTFWGRRYGVESEEDDTDEPSSSKMPRASHHDPRDEQTKFVTMNGGKTGRQSPIPILSSMTFVPPTHTPWGPPKPSYSARNTTSRNPRTNTRTASKLISGTGGYLADPYRDYTGEHNNHNKPRNRFTGKGHTKQRRRKKDRAVFIPCTQFSPTRGRPVGWSSKQV